MRSYYLARSMYKTERVDFTLSSNQLRALMKDIRCTLPRCICAGARPHLRRITRGVGQVLGRVRGADRLYYKAGEAGKASWQLLHARQGYSRGTPDLLRGHAGVPQGYSRGSC